MRKMCEQRRLLGHAAPVVYVRSCHFRRQHRLHLVSVSSCVPRNEKRVRQIAIRVRTSDRQYEFCTPIRVKIRGVLYSDTVGDETVSSPAPGSSSCGRNGMLREAQVVASCCLFSHGSKPRRSGKGTTRVT